MTDRFDGGDESRVQALMAENNRLKVEAAGWHGSFTGLAAREQELMAENERLREALEVLARDTPARPGSVIAREALDA